MKIKMEFEISNHPTECGDCQFYTIEGFDMGHCTLFNAPLIYGYIKCEKCFDKTQEYYSGLETQAIYRSL